MSAFIEIINGLAEQWVGAMWPIIWQSVVLAGVIYLLTLCLRRLPATVRFWLWMLVPLRLLVMPLITVSLPLLPAPTQLETANIEPVSAEMVIAESPVVRGIEITPVAEEFEPVSAAMQKVYQRIWPNVWVLMMWAWMVGIAFWSIRLIRGWCRIIHIANSAVEVREDKVLALTQKATTMLGLRRLPRILVTEESVSPFLFGVLRPVLVIPVGLVSKVSDEALLAVCAHEFAHLRRRDPLVGWILAVCETIYFFHPVIYFVKRYILFEREKACDECVIAISKSRRSIYANALVSAADVCRTFSAKMGPVGVVAESFGDLKKRLIAIGSNLEPKARLSVSALIMLVIIGAICVPGFVLTAHSTAWAEDESGRSTGDVTSTKFEGIEIEFNPEQAKGKNVLLCFWDMNQRPSRRLIMELAKREKELEEKSVVVLLVHTLNVDVRKPQRFLNSYKIPFTCGSINNDTEKVLFHWGVRAQPWLVLTNKKGVVRAGGFELNQLDDKLREKDSSQTSGKQESMKFDKVVLKLIDSDGRPVAGAKVGTNVRTSDVSVLGSKLSWNLRGREHNISNEWGEITLTREKLFPPSWSADRKLALYVLHEDQRIGATCMISKDGEREGIELILESVCRVHGKLDSEGLKKIGRPLTWTNVYLSWDRDSHGVLSHMPENKRFEFFVPPGRYTLSAYGSGEGASTKRAKPTFEVKANQSELDLGVIDLPPTKVTSLIGKSAPELGPVKAWKNGTPVKLADLHGKLVILHFGGGYPSTSRDLPRLVELHEEFENAGLVIISLYNCESMKQLEERFAEVSKKYGGEPDVPFRSAVDGGKGRPIEGTDRTIPGDTYAAYNISVYPTIVLINREGKIAEKLNLSGAKKKLENMLGVTVKPALSTWRQRFNKVYFLEEGQVLKRIAPPFIPERKEYYKQEHSDQASRIERAPDFFTFHWDGELKRWGAGFGSGKRPLRRVLNSNLSMNQNSYEGPEELLETDVPGDWIVLKDASEEQRLKALEEILAKEIGRDIRFEKRAVEHQAIIATGNFKYHRLPVVQDDRCIHIYSDDFTPDGGGGGGSGTVDSVSEFLQAIGDRVVMPVIDQTESTEEIRIPYRHHRSSYLSRIEDPMEKAEKLQLLLDNISHQTNLQFTVGRRPVEIWFVTEGNKEK
jgi:beta-lactamase regulating signal transducer with metallopeptidase domain